MVLLVGRILLHEAARLQRGQDAVDGGLGEIELTGQFCNSQLRVFVVEAIQDSHRTLQDLHVLDHQ